MDSAGTSKKRETDESGAPGPEPEAADGNPDEDVEGFAVDPNMAPLRPVWEQSGLGDIIPTPDLVGPPRATTPKYRKLGKHL